MVFRLPHFAACFILSLLTQHVEAALIHEWNFDETSGTNLADAVGSSDAEVVVLAGGGGHTLSGGAVLLDGGTRSSADYVTFPDDIFDGLAEVTIEVWAAPHSFPNWGRVIDIGPGDNPTEDNLRLSFSVATDGNQQWMALRPFTPVASALPTSTGQLYHYVIVWSSDGGAGGVPRIDWYRDGVYVGGHDTVTETIADLAALPQTTTSLGRSAITGDSTANASYYAVRIHDTPLSPAEVLLQNLKGPDADGPDGVDGLIHRYSFSENGGTTVADTVGTADGDVIVPGGGGGGHTLSGGELRLFGGPKDTSDYVELPAGLLNGLTDVSVEAWVTPQSAQNWSRLFDFGTGFDTDNTFFLSLCRGVDLNLQRLEFDTPGVFTLDTGLATTPGQEYHYVVTWSATGGAGGVGHVAWYRDGVLAAEADTGASTIADVDDTVLWLGRSQWPDDIADADFNEFRMYNRALTQTEINFNLLNGPDNVTIPPVEPVDDFMTLNPGAMALVPVLANDQGAQGDPDTLAVATPPANGTAVVKPGGKILYIHDGGISVADQFTYRVENSVGFTSTPATVFITVDASLRLANTTITVPDQPPPVSYGVEDAFPGLVFDDALAIRTPTGVTNQIFVVERRGIISYIPDIHAVTPVRQVFIDISGLVAFDDTPQGELGLLSMDFHPGFATNGLFYVFYTAPGGSPYFDVCSRFESTNGVGDPFSEQILFRMVDQEFNHNGGDIHFGPDGYLYIGTGDEGGQYNFRQNAQKIDQDFYSGILRIDVDKLPGSIEPTSHAAIPTDGGGDAYYSIPPDNPWVGATTFEGVPINTGTLRAEFWAVGFRHIWRMSFDPLTGELWAGDVGQDRWEEVNQIVAGGNYGWAYFEGTHQANQIYVGQPNLPNPPPGFVQIEPVYEYIHAGQGGDPAFSGDSVTGGIVYRGNNMPELYGAYIFADFEFQNIWALREVGTNVTVERLTADLGIAAFGRDPGNGDVLMANYFDNSITRLVRSDAGGSDFPLTLSDSGVFADLGTLTPNPGVVSYEPKIAFWSDYAIKTRWFTIPDLTNTVDFAVDANWTLPTGMKWIKHFDLETERGNPATEKRIETRILVKTDTGSFGASYKWNDAETEAYLVGDAGETFNIDVLDGTNMISQLYEIPSRAGCVQCHTPAGGHSLTFNTREMNSDGAMNNVVGNQIDELEAAGYFSGPVPAGWTLPVYATADDTTASLEFRSRSYLAVNCMQCHQPGGTAPGTWDARPSIPLAQTGLIDGVPNNNGGDPLNKLIVPGDPFHSVAWLRIQGTNGFGRMPPLGSHELDPTAIQLLADWIGNGLSERTFEQWQIAHFGSTNHPDAGPGENPDGDEGDNYYEFLTRTDPNDFADVWLLTGIGATNDQVSVSYEQVPNLGVLIDAAGGLDQPWSLWDAPGNTIWYPASNGLVTLTAPAGSDTNGFFRARFLEP